VTSRYTGASAAGAMSFELTGGLVSGFTFENRCPGSAGGPTVPASMRAVTGRFSYRDAQLTVSGRLLPAGSARGTARDVTGDCDTGTLAWVARVSGATGTPTPGDTTRIVAAFGDPAAATGCLAVRLSASDPSYATIAFRSSPSKCLRWAFNGVNVLEQGASGTWRVVFEGSAYACPIAHVPESVQGDLGVCPLAARAG
jgi:hypothetical protein